MLPPTAMNAVGSARSQRFIPEFLSTPHATNLEFSFAVVATHSYRKHSKEILMRKSATAVATGLVILFCQLAPSLAQTPDAVIELSGGSVGAGIGFSWGSGTLTFHGHRYPLKVTGISLVSVGGTAYTARGRVSGLKTPEDIDGVYTSAAAGGTLGGGRTAAAMENHNGVGILMISSSEGLNLTLAGEGVRITLAE